MAVKQKNTAHISFNDTQWAWLETQTADGTPIGEVVRFVLKIHLEKIGVINQAGPPPEKRPVGRPPKAKEPDPPATHAIATTPIKDHNFVVSPPMELTEMQIAQAQLEKEKLLDLEYVNKRMSVLRNPEKDAEFARQQAADDLAARLEKEARKKRIANVRLPATTPLSTPTPTS